MKVQISTTVPTKNADQLRKALGEAGAGVAGEYRYCSFSFVGTGRFMPTSGANPHIGEVDKLETVEEERVEVICDRSIAKEIVGVIRSAHPYEEVMVTVVPLLDEDDL